MLPYIEFLGRQIPLYGLCLVIAFYGITMITCFRAKKVGIKMEDVILFALFIFGGAIGGAFLLYLFVTYPIEHIIKSVITFNFNAIPGGLVFYGGFIGGFLCAMLGAKVLKIKLYLLEDIVIPLVPIGHAIGRLGCAFAGCCHGSEYYGIFAIKNYHIDPTGQMTFFPVQLVESALDIVIALVLFYFASRPHRRYNLAFLYVALYAIMRYGTEMLRADEVRGIFSSLSTSQYISIGLLAIVIVRAVVLFVVDRKKAKE